MPDQTQQEINSAEEGPTSRTDFHKALTFFYFCLLFVQISSTNTLLKGISKQRFVF